LADVGRGGAGGVANFGLGLGFEIWGFGVCSSRGWRNFRESGTVQCRERIKKK